MFRKATSPSNVGGIDADPDPFVLTASKDASGRSDLLDMPQLPRKTRTRKSLMFWSDKPSNKALAAADVVVGANKGLEGHVSASKADEERWTPELDDKVPLVSCVVGELPKPSSLIQNMKDHTVLIK